jgi:hypothetical protein
VRDVLTMSTLLIRYGASEACGVKREQSCRSLKQHHGTN